MERVKAGDAEAWQRFVDLYGPLIYGWCRRCNLQAEDAADVLQEVLAATAGHIAGFRRTRPGDSLRGWLWTIARNKIRDHVRRRKNRIEAEGGTGAQQRLAQVPDQPPDDGQSGQEAGNHDGLEHRAVELVRAGVEPRTWSAFWRVAVDQCPVAEVAEELGMSVRAVYEAKYRVRRQIRRELAELLD